MVAHSRKHHIDPTLGIANALARDTRLDAWKSTIHRSIYKNGSVDAVRAYTAERAKRKAGMKKGTIHFRSFKRMTRETIRIDAAQFHPHDKEKRGPPQNAGPVLSIQRAPPRPSVPWRRPSHACEECNRINGQVEFGTRLKAVGPIIFRDRRWLVERLVRERWLHHEAKILWSQPFDRERVGHRA